MSEASIAMKRFSSNKASSFREFSAAYAATSAAASRRLLRRSVEFPTSPQPNNGGDNQEIVHSSHAKHPLVEMTLPELFTCSGCKEYGAGKRYACQQCNFQLHDFCALSPPSLKTHPLHGQHQLLFHDKPKQGLGSPAAGGDQHGHGGSAAPAAVSCGKCGKKRAGRVYGCTACDYHLHAVCAKEMINGLQANGINPPEKPSVLGTAVKIAGQVVFEFIGGLIDGIGEGVGEAIVQNISGGRGSARIRATP
nr:Diacylglycerol kinase [Ipomoea batatas]GME05803.1 Diacylglycerol kinase [Ipomoea batatas]GME11055.1 Diacylglycerol kinase [Ipomoea batatas]